MNPDAEGTAPTPGPKVHPTSDRRHLSDDGCCLCVNDCCNTDGLCSCRECNRDLCMCDHTPEGNLKTFKAKDRIRPNGNGFYDNGVERTLEYVGKGWAIYTGRDGREDQETEYSISLAELKRNFEVVPDFFEVGKTYRRHASWSIAAQLNSVNERFEVKQVERNGNGLYVAFGRLTVVQTADTWVLRDEYSWQNDNWELDT